MEPFLGQIMIVGFNFAPRGWATCEGQILSIAQNTALFALLGTMYGGNGQTTFALPDLRGRVAVGQGQGPGLSSYQIGQVGGVETVTLTTGQIPAHNHNLRAVSEAGDVAAPANAFLAATGTFDPEYRASGTQVSMAAAAISQAGGSQPHENRQPYLGVNYVIALQGIFPSRD